MIFLIHFARQTRIQAVSYRGTMFDYSYFSEMQGKDYAQSMTVYP